MNEPILLVMVTRVALARSSGLASFQNKDEFFVKQSDLVYSTVFAKKWICNKFRLKKETYEITDSRSDLCDLAEKL